MDSWMDAFYLRKQFDHWSFWGSVRQSIFTEQLPPDYVGLGVKSARYFSLQSKLDRMGTQDFVVTVIGFGSQLCRQFMGADQLTNKGQHNKTETNLIAHSNIFYYLKIQKLIIINIKNKFSAYIIYNIKYIKFNNQSMQSSNIKKIEGYKVYMNKQLGKGAFGRVYQAVKDQNYERVAVKVLEKWKIDKDPYLKSALLSEIRIMKAVSSENIVKLYDVLESPNNYYIVQELCTDGNLEKLIKFRKEKNHKFSEKEAISMLTQMANGFLSLAREGIIHRDFKPANVMIKQDILKIGDFGFAKKSLTPGNCIEQTMVGTPLYMPLQLLKSQPYSSRCDIWALALIFYELLHLKTPWTANSDWQLVQNIQNQQLKIDESLSENTKDFLKKCLSLKQQNRLCWDQVFVHPIFQKHFESFAIINHEFEDKMKVIMSELRFQINANNLDLIKILSALGYKANQKQLTKADFFQFLRMINSNITETQAEYIFKRTDLDSNGLISMSEIQNLMGTHDISLTSIYKKVPIKLSHKTTSKTQKNQFDQNKLQQKAAHIFQELFNSLQKEGKTLYDTYQQHNISKNGHMKKQEFIKMLSSISNFDFSEEEMRYLFLYIDINRSSTIEFDEFNSYFSKINGIPPQMNYPNYMAYNMNQYPQSYYMAPPNMYSLQQPYLPQNAPPYIYGMPMPFNPNKNQQQEINELKKLAGSSKHRNKK